MAEKTQVVGVRFKSAGKVYHFYPNNIDVKNGDHVIVETSRGVEFGVAIKGNYFVDEKEISTPLKKILRIATLDDEKKAEDNLVKAKEAFNVCVKKIEKHKLNMKLVDVEYTFDHNKIIFYFSSDGRIDFRELVKDLASIFRTRIELRQIGVRDEAKMLNSIGICGRQLCCSTFLGDFNPVSIKMAKDQSLSLNPVKISGVCGRLMCCLKYEENVYDHHSKLLPNVSDTVETASGIGQVLSTSVLNLTVKVLIQKKEKEAHPTVETFPADQVKVIKSKGSKKTSDKELAKLEREFKKYE